MKLEPERVEAVRDQLERRFGLALGALSGEQVAGAFERARGAGGVDGASCERILDELPIDESWLFRDAALWEWLRTQEGPQLLERSLAQRRPIRVLSAGCSHGEEAFSAAIVLLGLLEGAGLGGSHAARYAQVLGLDASPARVAQARSGILAGWSVERGPQEEWLRRRLEPLQDDRSRWRVVPAVSALCRFEVANLCDLARVDGPPLYDYDLVFCRHVLIYFEAQAARRLVADLSRKLAPGAVLVVAAAEAHLLEELPHVEPLQLLGAGRARHGSGPASQPWRPAARRAPAVPLAQRPRVNALPAAATIEPAALPEPERLVQRMLEGEELMRRDHARGRTLLQGLLSELSALPTDRAFAADLSVVQLSRAIKSLLERGPR